MIHTMVSQVSWSAMGFLTTFLLARFLDVNIFALYALCLAARRGFVTLTGALLVSPLTVSSAAFESLAMNDYLQRVCNSVTLMMLVFCSLAMLTQLFSGLPVFAVALYLGSTVCCEVYRRVNYILCRRGRDNLAGFAALGSSMLGLVILVNTDNLQINEVLLLLSMAQITALLILQPGMIRFSGLRREECSALWKIGKWNLGSSLSTYVHAEIATLLTYSYLGAAALATLEIARQLVAFMQPLLFGMANHYHPILARCALVDTHRALARKLLSITGIQTAIAVFVLASVLLVSPWFIQQLMAEKYTLYQQSIPLAVILAVAVVARIGWQQPGFTMTALGKAHFAFFAKLSGSIVSLPLSYLMLQQFGVMGAVSAKLAGDLVILLVSLLLLTYLFNKRPA